MFYGYVWFTWMLDGLSGSDECLKVYLTKMNV
jgi:hypothetical protein